MVPSKIPTREWTTTRTPLGARATVFSTDRPDGIEVRDVHDTSAGRSPLAGQTPTHDRSLPDPPRPSGHPSSFKRSTLRCPCEYPANIIPSRDRSNAVGHTDVIALAQAQLAAAKVRPQPMRSTAPRRPAPRLDRDTRRYHPVTFSQVAPKKPSTLREHSFPRVRPGQSRVATRSFSPPTKTHIIFGR